ncbi:hypothetical protein C8Q80DRAFT_1120411 [Daedaleopsis nitida]|nr:hypothetical protein C8Q80DRAFT_1120411 [Daedaleopsis nitida]
MPHALAQQFFPDTCRLIDESMHSAIARVMRLTNEFEDLASSGNTDAQDSMSYAMELSDALINVYILQGDPDDTLRYVKRIHNAATRDPNTAAIITRVDGAVVRARREFRLAELCAEVDLRTLEETTLQEVSNSIDRMGDHGVQLALRCDAVCHRVVTELDIAQRALTALEQADIAELPEHGPKLASLAPPTSQRTARGAVAAYARGVEAVPKRLPNWGEPLNTLEALASRTSAPLPRQRAISHKLIFDTPPAYEGPLRPLDTAATTYFDLIKEEVLPKDLAQLIRRYSVDSRRTRIKNIEKNVAALDAEVKGIKARLYSLITESPPGRDRKDDIARAQNELERREQRRQELAGMLPHAQTHFFFCEERGDYRRLSELKAKDVAAAPKTDPGVEASDSESSNEEPLQVAGMPAPPPSATAPRLLTCKPSSSKKTSTASPSDAGDGDEAADDCDTLVPTPSKPVRVKREAEAKPKAPHMVRNPVAVLSVSGVDSCKKCRSKKHPVPCVCRDGFVRCDKCTEEDQRCDYVGLNLRGVIKEYGGKDRHNPRVLAVFNGHGFTLAGASTDARGKQSKGPLTAEQVVDACRRIKALLDSTLVVKVLDLNVLQQEADTAGISSLVAGPTLFPPDLPKDARPLLSTWTDLTLPPPSSGSEPAVAPSVKKRKVEESPTAIKAPSETEPIQKRRCTTMPPIQSGSSLVVAPLSSSLPPSAPALNLSDSELVTVKALRRQWGKTMANLGLMYRLLLDYATREEEITLAEFGGPVGRGGAVVSAPFPLAVSDLPASLADCFFDRASQTTSRALLRFQDVTTAGLLGPGSSTRLPATPTPVGRGESSDIIAVERFLQRDSVSTPRAGRSGSLVKGKGKSKAVADNAGSDADGEGEADADDVAIGPA